MAGIGIENLTGLNTLVFGSLEFLFRYLPIFLIVFFLITDKYRNIVLFLGSLLLYGLGEPVYFFLLAGMTTVNYLFGRCIQKKGMLAIALACNLGLLIYFKVSNALDAGFLLPLGLSFYSFKSISYLLDVYKGKIEAESSFWRFGAYICMFCQIVSGPIMRYQDAKKGLVNRKLSFYRLEDGCKKLVFGLLAKVLIADRLAILWNDIQTVGFESISTPLAWLGAFAWSLMLYFDFAGYTLMAVGIGQMLGLPVVKNFDRPYAARSVSEFYRRWHMTLGDWFRDYVYIPLGGNRKGRGRTVCNLLLVWALTGLWHGNSPNFLLWGLLLGCLVVIEKLALGSFLKKHSVIAHLYVLITIPLTWMVFAIPSPTDLGVYFARLFPFFGVGNAINVGDFQKEILLFAPTLAAGCLFSIPAVGLWFEKHRNDTGILVLLFALFWFAVYRITIAGNNPFLYAAF